MMVYLVWIISFWKHFTVEYHLEGGREERSLLFLQPVRKLLHQTHVLMTFKPRVSSCFLVSVNPHPPGCVWIVLVRVEKEAAHPLTPTLRPSFPFSPVSLFSPTPSFWFIIRLSTLQAPSAKWATKNTALQEYIQLLFLLFFNASSRRTKQLNKGEKVLWLRRRNAVTYFVHFNYTKLSFSRSPRKAFTDLPSFDIFNSKPLPIAQNINIFMVILKPPTPISAEPVRQALRLSWCGGGWTSLDCSANETYFRHSTDWLVAFKRDLWKVG